MVRLFDAHGCPTRPRALADVARWAGSGHRPARRHAAGHRQRDRVGDFPDHRHDGGRSAVDSGPVGRLGRRRPAGDGRRPHLRRDGLDVPADRRHVRLPRGGIRAGVGVPFRLGGTARRAHRQRRRGRCRLRRVLQLLRAVAGHLPHPVVGGAAHGVGRRRRCGRVDSGHWLDQPGRRDDGQPRPGGADHRQDRRDRGDSAAGDRGAPGDAGPVAGVAARSASRWPPSAWR